MSVIATGFGYAAAIFTVPSALGVLALRRICGGGPVWDHALRFATAYIPAAFGISVRVRGSQNGRVEGPVVLVANHVNIFDGFIVWAHLTFSFRAVELEGHFSWPVYGMAMRLFGNIPISHSDTRGALGSLERAARVLAAGVPVLVLPEGHRTRTGALLPFMRGPFRLAKAAAVPILPIVLQGEFERKRVGSLRVTPGTVEIVILPLVDAATVASMDERGLRDRVRARMSAIME